MRWTSRDLQVSFYFQTIYKEVIGICKKSVPIYQTRVNPPRIMLRSIIYKTSLCCVSSMKTKVKEMLAMCSILSNHNNVPGYLLSSSYTPVLMFLVMKQLFSFCMNFYLRSMAEILVSWCGVLLPILSWFPGMHYYYQSELDGL